MLRSNECCDCYVFNAQAKMSIAILELLDLGEKNQFGTYNVQPTTLLLPFLFPDKHLFIPPCLPHYQAWKNAGFTDRHKNFK